MKIIDLQGIITENVTITSLSKLQEAARWTVDSSSLRPTYRTFGLISTYLPEEILNAEIILMAHGPQTIEITIL